MKYTFKQTYTFPVTVASAVVAYLDCEHYTFLHKSCEKRYKTISLTGNKCISEILYKSGIFSWKQKSTTEYIGLAELKQYDISIYGFGPAIIANFFNVSTSLRYFENNEDRMVEDIEDDFKLKRIDKNDTQKTPGRLTALPPLEFQSSKKQVMGSKTQRYKSIPSNETPRKTALKVKMNP